MNKNYENIIKLIIGCYFGIFLFNSPSIAVESNIKSNTQPTPSIRLRQSKLASDSIKLQGNVSITTDKQLITLSLRDSDVRQVIRMLADKAALNVIFDNSVTGTVTLDLVNVTLNKAFDYVMTLNNLKYSLDGDTLIVASSDSANGIGFNKQQIKPIQIKYLEAEKVATFLNENIFGLNNPGLSNDKIVVTNPRRNEVMIFGSDNDIALAKKVIEHIDVKPEIKTYKINHLPAGKMASLICGEIFNAESPDGDSDKADGKGGGKLACEGTVPENITGSSSSGSKSDSASKSASSGSRSRSNNSRPQLPSESSIPSVSENNMSSGTSESISIETTPLVSLDDKGFQVYYYSDLGNVQIKGATVEQIAMIEDFIKENDIKQPQVYIEMAILELSESGSKAFTSVWDYSKGKISLQGGASSLSATDGSWDGTISSPISQINTVTDPVTGNDASLVAIPGGITWSGGLPTYGPDYQPNYTKVIKQFISYLLTENKGKLLSNPKIIATNNQQSTINITSQYISGRHFETIYTSSGTTTNVQYDTDDAGIKIDLTPQISPGGYVKLSIKPSYTSIGEQLKDSLGIVLTLTNSRDLDIKDVIVKDGDTIILGGLVQEYETKSIKKYPLLGDLPVVGALFRSSSTDKQKTELIIMVTPKILKDDKTANAV